MNFNKKKGISTVAILIILAVFSAAAFLLPLNHTLTFWLGYSFAVISAVILLACLLFLFDSQYKERMFLRLSIAKLGWGYFTLQILLSIWEMTEFSTSYLPALVINAVLAGFYIVSILASSAAGEAIERQDEHIAQKVVFIKNMQGVVSQIKTQDDELAKELGKLQEDIRFSDPMSHSMLDELENQIETRVIMLKSEIADKDKARESIEYISDLLKERNQKCRLYKKIKDDKLDYNDSGVRYVSVTIGVLGTIAALAAVICCIIIPKNIYKTGVSLYENKKYGQAAEIFESLDGFSDSKEMLAACEEGTKGVEYSDALKLLDDKEYEQAISIFESLGDYKDSKDMIETVMQQMAEDKYSLAQSKVDSQDYIDAIDLFTELGDYKDSKDMIESVRRQMAEDKYILAQSKVDSQDYIDAIDLYTELEGYKDCKEKIEKIKNRLAADDVIYFGTYNDEPIAWQVIKNEDDRILLIAEDSVCELPYNDELKNVEWNKSTLSSWLNNEFVKSFSDNQQVRIIPQEIDGTEYTVFILKESDIGDIKNKSVLESDLDWWLLTKAEESAKAMFVSQNGDLNRDGETVVRAKGVRPCIWIEL